MVPGRHPRHDPADEPGQHVVEDGNTFRALTPTGGRAEAVGAAAGEGGGEFLLVLAEYVDADVLGLGDRGPAGGADTDAEGDDRGLGGDRAERGGGEAHGTRVALRRDHGDTGRVLPEDGAQEVG